MRFVTLLLIVIAALLHGCAAVPARVAAPQAESISWTRGFDAEAFVDQHGVCHVFSRDNPGAMHALGRQVKACFERALPVVTTSAVSIGQRVNVSWQQVSGAEIDDLFSRHASESVLHAAGRRKAAAVFAVRGFYTMRGDTCHVVVADHAEHVATLGHEFKHCIDGDFHDERGVWRQYRAG